MDIRKELRDGDEARSNGCESERWRYIAQRSKAHSGNLYQAGPRGLVDNINMDLGDIGWGIDCIGLAQDRNNFRAVVCAVMNIRVP
jgi:hypothetical protein